jgi:hypothetical protein
MKRDGTLPQTPPMHPSIQLPSTMVCCPHISAVGTTWRSPSRCPPPQSPRGRGTTLLNSGAGGVASQVAWPPPLDG